ARMALSYENQSLSSESESEDSVIHDKELQEAFSKGALKPGLNVVLEGQQKPLNNVDGLKQCLCEFKRHLAWVERLDVTYGQAPNVMNLTSPRTPDKAGVDPDDDFQREMSFYRQAQAAVLEALPQLHHLKVPTRRPDDYFAEMAKSDQQMQKVRRSDSSGPAVQTEVLQKRQKEKATMLNAIKKYQKGLSDKLDFLDGKQLPPSQGKTEGTGGQQIKKGPNAKRRYKNQKFGFGGKKKGSKWNTRESHNDVSSFRASVAHNKGPGKAGKRGTKVSEKHAPRKRPGKKMRQKMKNRAH
uniref:EBNA1 binding protein 2 n=1 Tax=Sphenodon punctatus TaxID=8508 RepID=A0A8D0GRK3_SPHPU